MGIGLERVSIENYQFDQTKLSNSLQHTQSFETTPTRFNRPQHSSLREVTILHLLKTAQKNDNGFYVVDGFELDVC